jgi:cell wall-associated NlpC family hydrolase
VATPHTFLTRALAQSTTDVPAGHSGVRRSGRLRSGLLVGATAALTVSVLPATAAAVPGDVTDPGQVAQRVADAEHELEVVSEQVNDARVALEEQEAAAADADRVAAEAQAALDALDAQIREVARSAYTDPGLSQFALLLTSDSAEDFVAQLGTLDAIAGHTNEVVGEVSLVADQAESAQAAADVAEEEARKILDDITAQQRTLEFQIAEYQREYAALTAPQQQEVARAHGGAETVAAPSGVVAPSRAAQVAVDTALAQVGDAYVWGAGGPDAFDCSGLTQYAYSAAGMSLAHSSRIQSQMGTPVSSGDLQPGDLLFYYSPTSHVAMYVGNGKMVHASTSSKPVMVVDFDSMSGFTHARRIAG